MARPGEIVIRGATIVDGTGAPPVRGDVVIRGERIAQVGGASSASGQVIDASGLVASPGFIDPHSQADQYLAKYPFDESIVMQGVTTILGGACGHCVAPINDRTAVAVQERLGLATTPPWRTFAAWLAYADSLPPPVNYALLASHYRIRDMVMGTDCRRSATEVEIAQMKSEVDLAMRAGAYGLSTNPDLRLTQHATVEEHVELARVAAAHGGLLHQHMRHTHQGWPAENAEDDRGGATYGHTEDAWLGPMKGYREGFEIARRAKLPLHIAHLSNAYVLPQRAPDYLEEAGAKATLALVDKARGEGLRVTFDVIPEPDAGVGRVEYTIECVFSPWISRLGKDGVIEALKSGEVRKEVLAAALDGTLKLRGLVPRMEPWWPDSFRIVGCKNPEYVGRSIGEVARGKGCDGIDAVADLLIEDPEMSWSQMWDSRRTPTATAVFLQHPLAMFTMEDHVRSAEPAAGIPAEPAPITSAAYAYVFATYVREQHLFPLQEAVRKATLLPAQMMGLRDRGALRPGMYADIVLFDPNRIAQVGTPTDPARPPEGIEYVLINGQLVYSDKHLTGDRAGKVLQHLAA